MPSTFVTEVVVDGVKVKYDPCEHCDAVPTQTEIRSALKMAREFPNNVCVVCGEKQKILEIEIYHYKEHGQNRWGSRDWSKDIMLVLQDKAGLSTLEVPIHPKCAQKAMPHAKWGFSLL